MLATRAGSDGASSDCHARTFLQAMGVGAPRSLITVTTASPPSESSMPATTGPSHGEATGIPCHATYTLVVIFKSVGEGRPYPEHGRTAADWAQVAPRVVRLNELVTVKRTLDLATLLDEESTFFGDLFPHVVEWNADLYLEDGLHRALRTALHGRPTMHARVLDLTAGRTERGRAE